jgi:CubicO group peptidase (beta-lactamase class C family)
MKRALIVIVAVAAACRAGGPPIPVSAGLPLASPASLGFDSVALDSATAYLRSQVDSSYPGAVLAVGRHGRLALLAAVGHYAANDSRPVTPETIYDLASLSKVVGWTTACMQLVDAGKLDLDAPVERYVPEFRGAGKERVTVRHLLTHTAGFPPDLPLWTGTRSRAEALQLVDTAPLVSVPGEKFVYSDVSAIVGMQVVEHITGEPIDRYLAEHVFGPLGMPATRYLPPRSWRADLAPTEVDTFFRHRLLIGEVHDESAAQRRLWQRGALLQRARSFALRRDAARGRDLGHAHAHPRGNGRRLHAASGHSAGVFTGAGVGHPVPAVERGNPSVGAGVRAYGVYGHVDVARSAGRSLHHSADEPRQPDAQQHADPAGPAAGGRSGGHGAAAPRNVSRGVDSPKRRP